MQPAVKKKNAQLTAPGNGSSINMGSVQPANGTGKITVGAINTNVVVRYDYSSTSNFAAVVQGEALTITANGAYAIPLLMGYKFCRPVFVSESGGATATVDVTTELYY